MSPDCRQSPGLNKILSNTAGESHFVANAVVRLYDEDLTAPTIPQQMAAARQASLLR